MDCSYRLSSIVCRRNTDRTYRWLCLAVLADLDLLALADVHADLARLDLLGLRNIQPQHAVGQRGLDLIGLDGARQADRPLERAEAALDAMVAAILVLALAAGLALDRQHVVLDRDLDFLGLQARQRRLDHKAILGLAQV